MMARASGMFCTYCTSPWHLSRFLASIRFALHFVRCSWFHDILCEVISVFHVEVILGEIFGFPDYWSPSVERLLQCGLNSLSCWNFGFLSLSYICAYIPKILIKPHRAIPCIFRLYWSLLPILTNSDSRYHLIQWLLQWCQTWFNLPIVFWIIDWISSKSVWNSMSCTFFYNKR